MTRACLCCWNCTSFCVSPCLKLEPWQRGWCLPVHSEPPSLSQSWLSWFIDSFLPEGFFFSADPYKSARDVSGWDGLGCAFCSRTGMSDSSRVPHWKVIWQTIPPPNKPKSLKAQQNSKKIDGSPSSQGIRNVDPFFLLMNSWREKEVRAK